MPAEFNYHHLRYFWEACRAGSITLAARRLGLSQPTLSAQIRALELRCGGRLFERTGRTLVPTELGRTVHSYADEIFTVGRQLAEAVAGRQPDRPLRFVVGVSDSLSKLAAYRLLQPALAVADAVQLCCLDGPPDELMPRLALHELDLVLSDSPANPQVRMRVFNHLLGECGVSFLAAAPLAARYRRKFPASLSGAPLLLPAPQAALRRALDTWFESHGLRPQVRGEFADSALLKTFGQAGHGVFPAPTVIEAEIRRQYGVRLVGRVAEVRERIFAVSAERRIKHPGVAALTVAARAELFTR